MGLIEFTTSKEFELYNEIINKAIAGLEDEILTLHPTNNEVKYSAHDINREILRYLKAMRQAPVDALEGISAELQQDEDTTKTALVLLEKTKEIAGKDSHKKKRKK